MRHPKKYRNAAIAAAIGTALGTWTGPASAQEVGEIRWFGSIYAKFLDGDRNYQNALYNNAETTPGEAGGDQGQGIEFELMFNSQVSKQIEIGGRIKARFNKNFWTNFGGFGPQEADERSAQYMKLRGAWVTITPGYDWVDSATIGSNDWGMFDPWTVGKFRYIDRDNSSGFLVQGSQLNKKLRWDIARVSLSRLFQGPRFLTTDDPNDPILALEANDAAWIGQVRYTFNPDFNITGIVEYVVDDDIDTNDTDLRDGQETFTRYDNFIAAFKFQATSLGPVDLGGAYYWSNYNVHDTKCNGSLNGDCRFSPTLQGPASDASWTLNIDVNRLGVDGLSLDTQFFQVGARYQSVTAARRESDVLLTEGLNATWQWGRPDYNFGNRNNPVNANIGYGGWVGETQQVVSGMADNDFTDFDEPVAYSVIGWQGVTVVPRYLWNNWEFFAEYSYIDFDTNWQACNNAPDPATGLPSKDFCIYPRMDGTHAWGLGGDYRSPYAPYQERTMQIFTLGGNYTWDVGSGIDLTLKYGGIQDEDDRVTNPALLPDGYDGFPDAAAATALNPDWVPNIGLGGCVTCDDRRMDSNTFATSLGYQLHPDLYGRLVYAHHEVDLIDGTVDVAPVGMGFEASNDFGYAEYLTGEHKKDVLGGEFSYFLSGMEFGASVYWWWGTYDPVFYTDQNQQRVRLIPDASTTAVTTPVGNIAVNKVDYRQYRLKAFIKVSF